MFGTCKVCQEKDRRILDLQEQISTLRSMAFPSPMQIHVPQVQLEADKMLSGDDIETGIPGLEQEESERDRILSGNYDQPE